VFWRRKEPRIELTLDQCLAALVVPNPDAKQRVLPSGRIEVSLPYLKPWLIRWLSRKDKKTFLRRFELDDLGSELWRLCDGRHTVAELVDYVATSGGLPPDSARESLIAYLHMLMVRGLVGLVVPQQEPAQSSQPADAGEADHATDQKTVS